MPPGDASAPLPRPRPSASGARGNAGLPSEGELLRLLVHSVADYAIFALDAQGRVSTWNEGARRIKGYEADEIIGQHFSVFYPQELRDQGYPDRELVVAAEEGSFHDEGWRLRKGGEPFLADVVITALRDDSGDLVGFAKVTRDLTHRVREEEIRESEEHLRLLAENLDEVFYVADPRLGRLVYVNPVFEDVFGTPPDPLLQDDAALLEWVHPGDRDEVEAALDRRDAGEPTDLVYRILRGGVELRWIHDRSFPVERSEGRHRRAVGIAEDVTDWKRVEDAREFLADATRFLSASLDRDDILHDLARVAVPRLGDWCRIHLLADDGTLVAGDPAHADPAKLQLAREMERKYPPRFDFPGGVGTVIRTGEAAVFEEVGEEQLRDASASEEHFRMVLELGLRSAIIVPMTSRQRVLGAITLVFAESGRRYRDEDVALAMELGSRAALALDNARLLEAERRARERVERRAASNRFLLSASTLLASSLDYRETLSRLVDLAVPELADRCTVYTMEPGGRLEWIAGASVDPDESTAAGSPRVDYDPVEHPSSLPIKALTTGETVLVQPVSAEHRAAWRTAEGDDELTSPGVTSALVVPMSARGHRVGVIGFAQAGSGRLFSEAEVSTAEEVARRAAVAVDNARLYHQAEVARREAEEASRAKSDFLAVMSHELRTPLNAIVGYGDLLDSGVSGPVNKKQHQHLGRIRSSAWHLLDLIEEILSLSKIEAGKMDLRWEEVDAAELAEDAGELVRPEADGKGLAFRIEEPEEAVRLDADRGRARQILINLLSNAVKFTEAGAVVLSWEAVDDDVLFHVRDTGPGIPERDREMIFEPFTRSPNVGRRPHEGTGLGLSVSRRFARLMGGDLTLETVEGEGSVFTLRLPMERLDDS